jgi:hypothetical protein
MDEVFGCNNRFFWSGLTKCLLLGEDQRMTGVAAKSKIYSE